MQPNDISKQPPDRMLMGHNGGLIDGPCPECGTRVGHCDGAKRGETRDLGPEGLVFHAARHAKYDETPERERPD
jgi:hypothetical protein